MMVGVDGEEQKRRRGFEVAGKVKERVEVVQGAGGEGRRRGWEEGSTYVLGGGEGKFNR